MLGQPPSDATFALDTMLEKGFTDSAIGMIWDPLVVDTARKAGAGARISVRLGGKTAACSGQPLDLDVTVKHVISGFIQPFPQENGEAIPVPCGDTVCLECQGIAIIVNSIRTQVFHPDIFIRFGLDLGSMKLLVVKSIFHFYAGFAPVAEEILLMGAPGPLNARFTEVPYQKANLQKFPCLDNPFQ
ncbi:MAG: MlrC C-terminal domain-containing protein [Endozoicomonas sp.]